MRINRTPAETEAAAYSLGEHVPDSREFMVRLAACLALAAATVVGLATHAAAGDMGLQPKVTGCHKVDEVKSSMFPHEQIVAFDFSGPDAGRLQRVMDGMAKMESPDATLIRLVLVPDADEAVAFQFGADGCHTITIEYDFARMADVFHTAGVDAPFGATYYAQSALAI